MAKDNGLKHNWSKVWGKQLADKDMCRKYREGWERIWGDKTKDADDAALEFYADLFNRTGKKV